MLQIFSDPQVGQDAVQKYVSPSTGSLTDEDIREFVSILHQRHLAEMSFINHYTVWISGQQELNRRMLCLADQVDAVAGTFMNIIGSAWYIAGVIITLTLGKVGIQIPTLATAVRKVTDIAAYTVALLPYGLTCIFASCSSLHFRASTQADIKQTKLIREDLLRLQNCEDSLNTFCDDHGISQQHSTDNCNMDEVDSSSPTIQSKSILNDEQEVADVSKMYDLVKSSVEVHVGPKMVTKPTLRKTVKKRVEEEQKITVVYTTLMRQQSMET